MAAWHYILLLAVLFAFGAYSEGPYRRRRWQAIAASFPAPDPMSVKMRVAVATLDRAAAARMPVLPESGARRWRRGEVTEATLNRLRWGLMLLLAGASLSYAGVEYAGWPRTLLIPTAGLAVERSSWCGGAGQGPDVVAARSPFPPRDVQRNIR